MNTNISISLDKRRIKKDNTYPLILRISHQRRTIPIPTGLSFSIKDWDEKNNKVKNSYKGTESVNRLNNLILKKKSAAFDVITKFEEEGTLSNFSIKQIKDKILNSGKITSFFSFTEELILEMITSNRLGNARSYKSALNALKKFNKSNDLKFNQLNYDFLKKFEIHHLSKGNSLNGLAVYLRGVRAIYNKAIKEGLVEKQFYPFENYTIRTKPTVKRAIKLEHIVEIKELDLDSKHICFQARNYFLTSFYMMGVSFIDMAFLKLENIIDGRIIFQRKKTDTPYNIKISPKLQDILNFYIEGKTKNDYIFNIISSENLIQQYKQVDGARKRYNKKLKILAELCGISENLTSYVSRHSFASIAKNKGIPVVAISEMMGHQSIKTTQIYLNSLSSNKIDDYNDEITDI